MLRRVQSRSEIWLENDMEGILSGTHRPDQFIMSSTRSYGNVRFKIERHNIMIPHLQKGPARSGILTSYRGDAGIQRQ